MKRKLPKTHFRLPIFLIVIGLALMGLWGVHRFFYNRSMSLSDALLAWFAEGKPSGSLPIYITVGDRIRAPIVGSGKQDGIWAISKTSANHVANSSVPGHVGNSIIYAHNTNDLFGPLDKVKKGDPITVRMTDGTLHRYSVISVVWVTPGHRELLSPTNHEALTLYTCGGLLDALRIVVRAIPDSREAQPISAVTSVRAS